MKNEKSNSQSSRENREEKMYSIRVWDIPTRFFHWLLVGLVIFSFITGKIGVTTMKYHEWSGFAILVLVGFRLVWGFIGGQQSRFRTFVKGPAAVIRYASSLLSKDSKQHIGHNPLGGWSILAMLASLLIQVGTGLFANDDILTEGPLFALVSKQTSDWLTGIHHLNQKILLVLVLIHIAAVIFYFIVKRDNLIKPMITGNKTWHQNIDSAPGNPALAIVLAAVVAAVAYVIIY
jgi:cytochrome b